MKNLTSFVLAASMIVAATGAFAGGVPETMPEPPTVVVTDGGSSSGASTVLLVLGGAVLIAALVSQSDSTNSTEPTETVK